MLVGRYSWELSGRNLHRKIKNSQTPTGAEGLRFRGPFLEMFFDRALPGFLPRSTGNDRVCVFQ